MNEIRIEQKFLYLPKRINGKIKWLVNAKWEEERVKVPWTFYLLDGYYWSDWKPTKWL